ncbi:ribosomal RNA small subunit methyltransferase E [Spirochaetia bacterium]|nr:ribosomal RNA small subunit methyltransferase E [Spirochaetia bacterium]
MNLILFEEHELGKALPRRDERTTHLIKVLHKKAGDRFDAGVLGGNRGTGIIEKINLDGSILYSLNLDEAPPPRLPLRLAVGFPRPIQLRRLLRDLSNLGLEAIDLIGTELGDKSYRDTKLLSDGGAEAALIEGAVQSRDTLIPTLSVYVSLEEWLAEKPWDKTARLGLGPLLIAADNVRPGGSIARLSLMRRSAVLAIGPERGWSDGERDRLEEAGFLRLSMGERALRTETACVAAAVLALEKIGELG